MASTFPYLDKAGLKRRSSMPDGDVEYIVTSSPGFLEATIADEQESIESRLRKRYAPKLPFGQAPAQPTAIGTDAPEVTLSGRPTCGSLLITIEITTAGVVGVAVFRWSLDGGQSWTSNVTTAAIVELGATGISATFPAGAYATTHRYVAPEPVPRAILRWLAAFVTVLLYDRRGRDPQDPGMVTAQTRADRADAQLKESADGEGGFIELPTNDAEQATSAVSAGGPFGYSEPDPYTWTDVQREAVRGC